MTKVSRFNIRGHLSSLCHRLLCEFTESCEADGRGKMIKHDLSPKNVNEIDKIVSFGEVNPNRRRQPYEVNVSKLSSTA